VREARWVIGNRQRWRSGRLGYLYLARSGQIGSSGKSRILGNIHINVSAGVYIGIQVEVFIARQPSGLPADRVYRVVGTGVSVVIADLFAFIQAAAVADLLGKQGDQRLQSRVAPVIARFLALRLPSL
jgi:hypothetical protein